MCACVCVCAQYCFHKPWISRLASGLLQLNAVGSPTPSFSLPSPSWTPSICFPLISTFIHWSTVGSGSSCYNKASKWAKMPPWVIPSSCLCPQGLIQTNTNKNYGDENDKITLSQFWSIFSIVFSFFPKLHLVELPFNAVATSVRFVNSAN